jgi:Heterokaryon incompatibility protein (HET)
MTSPTDQFAYRALNSEEADSFRLLNLLPGDDESPIQCELRHTRGSDTSHSYEALSYPWGDPTLESEFLLNGSLHRITHNLERALRSLRHRSDGPARTLWVDAICIDQSQVFERNHQLAQMGEIYAAAHRVIIWLGEASEDSDTAISFMETVHHSLATNGAFSSGTLISTPFQRNIGEAITSFVGYRFDQNGTRWPDFYLGIGGKELR